MESIERIRKTLERFYQGESTLKEEKWLQDYFSSSSVPEELLPDKELFNTFVATGDSIVVPRDLNRNILDTIDQLESKELKTRRISMISLSGLAAGLLAMIAVYVFFLRTDQPALLAGQQISDTYEDPMQAYHEAKQTLAYVSAKLNVGTNELGNVQRVTKSAAKPLNSLSKINSGSKELVLLGQLQKVRELN